jgi:predicted RNase H-like nuclease
VHVGLDLAWSTRARTGVAAVDAAGALVDSATVGSDDEILDWIVAAGRPAVIAIDAPLIVTNATGMRECERAIGRAYARFHASCHVSNLTRPWCNPPRALSLAQRAGWSTDPDHRATPDAPGCVEAYPHAGMVGLFGLDRIIPYKSKPGRGVEQRRHAFTDLIGHLEAIEALGLAGHPRWATLAGAARTATRHVELERIEDEIDAIFCAHLAWRWARRDGLEVYGSTAEGCIVAPPPPVRQRAQSLGVSGNPSLNARYIS